MPKLKTELYLTFLLNSIAIGKRETLNILYLRFFEAILREDMLKHLSDVCIEFNEADG